MPLKFLSLNIESDEHLDLILPYLEKEQPDVVAFQEVLASDVARFEQVLHAKSVFVPFARTWTLVHEKPTIHISANKEQPYGIAIFSKCPIVKQDIFAYAERDLVLEGRYKKANFDSGPIKRSLLTVEVEFEGKIYRIATTHYYWTPDGSVTNEQREGAEKILTHLKTLGPTVLAGDFNAPRGREVFDRFASAMKDNIPPEVQTTIDPNIHRVKNIMLVVDGLFSQTPYVVNNVRVLQGLSDHCAIAAEISQE